MAELSKTREWHGIGREQYVVGRCSVNFKSEIDPRLGSVQVECAIRELGRSSVTTSERIVDAAGNVVVEAEFGIVLWDPSERGPRPITAGERDRATHSEAVTCR